MIIITITTIKENAAARLLALGYTLLPGDLETIERLSKKVSDEVIRLCAIKEVPEGLIDILSDRVCGEFLKAVKACRKLTDFDLQADIREVTEGDTKITYAYGEGRPTPEERFNDFLEYLINGSNDIILSYRKVRW